MTDSSHLDQIRAGYTFEAPAVDLGAAVYDAIAERNDFDPAAIEDVICGCVSQGGEQAMQVGRNAVLAALIFNALVIVFLIPLALKGVSYKPMSAAALLRRNLWLYGVGGLLVPFVGIKLIDLILVALHVAG